MRVIWLLVCRHMKLSKKRVIPTALCIIISVVLSRKYNQTILIITHDQNVAACCDRQFYIEDGEIR